MHTLHGTVKNIRHTIDVRGSNSHFVDPYIHGRDTSTTQIALFELDGHRVQYSADCPAPLQLGDQISVLGSFDRGGLFHAVAYRNATARISGDDGKHWEHIGLGLIASLLGPALVLIFLTPSPQDTHYTLPFILLALLGLAAAVSGLLRWQAVREFKGQRSRPSPVGMRPSRG